jgi:hypothetical protein
MKRGTALWIAATAAVLGITLAALTSYSVRDYLAALLIFSVAFLALGVLLLVAISAEEVLLWAMRWTESYFQRLRLRQFPFAAHLVHQSRLPRAR